MLERARENCRKVEANFFTHTNKRDITLENCNLLRVLIIEFILFTSSYIIIVVLFYCSSWSTS